MKIYKFILSWNIILGSSCLGTIAETSECCFRTGQHNIGGSTCNTQKT